VSGGCPHHFPIGKCAKCDAEKLLKESIAWWAKLANDEKKKAHDEKQRGFYAGVHEAKAKTYEHTARSLQMELETGVPHCNCFLHAIPLPIDKHHDDIRKGGRR
jgi:hypothetical protein